MRRLTIALVVALAGCTTTPTPAQTVASPSPSAITQTATPGPAGNAATVAAMIACAGRDLTVRGGRMGGGTSTAQGAVYFTNVGWTPCTLSGDPESIELLRVDGSRLPITAQPPDATPGSPATLPPGTRDAANLAFNWANWCGAAPGPMRVRITLPGGGTVTGPFDGPPEYDFIPRCDNSSEPSFMELLWSFTPR
jgi:hypothetical protein